MIKSVILDTRDVLLDIQNDEMEDLASLSLQAAQIGLSRAKKTLNSIVPPPSNLERQGPHAYISELSEKEEIEWFGSSSPKKKIDLSSSMESEKGKKTSATKRLIWQPLVPKINMIYEEMLKKIDCNPLNIVAFGLFLLPLSPLLLGFGVPILIFDYILQSFYETFGDVIEDTYESGKRIIKLNYLLLKISLRQTYRMVNKQIVKSGGYYAYSTYLFGNIVRACSKPKETIVFFYTSAANVYSTFT